MIHIAVYHVGPKGWTNLSGDDVGELHYSYYLVEPSIVMLSLYGLLLGDCRHKHGTFYPFGNNSSYLMMGYVAAWDHELIPVAKEFKPDVILISAGFDACHCDIRIHPPRFNFVLDFTLRRKLCTPFAPAIDEVSPFPDNEVSLR
ncbi:histone deacetylase 5 [Tanacetum coccineum]